MAGEERLPCLVPPLVPKFSLMVWDCILYDHVGTLAIVDCTVNALRYNAILNENLCPAVACHSPAGNFTFQDDNALIQ